MANIAVFLVLISKGCLMFDCGPWSQNSETLTQLQHNPTGIKSMTGPTSNPFAASDPTTLVLFDVDGTLTPARLAITKEMKQLLADLRKRVVIGFVGGSDLPKQQEQIAENCIDLFDYCVSYSRVFASAASLLHACIACNCTTLNHCNYLMPLKYKRYLHNT